MSSWGGYRPRIGGTPVDRANLTEAYLELARLLHDERFEAPAQGWGAELIAAHVVTNNDLIAEVAERLAAGEQISYDNAAAIDPVALQSFAEQVGGLEGLAERVERSAARLEQARDALSDAQLGTELHVLITDDGETVLDGPLALGQLIEGNAAFHLDNHLRQLESLRSPRTAEPPAKFDAYELVLLLQPDDRPEIDQETADLLQSQHLGHLATMREAGHLKVAGPLGGGEDRRLRGIGVYQVGSIERARELAEQDPAVRAGLLAIEVLRWYTQAGALVFGPLPDREA